LGTIAALILIAAPVRGLRPLRAAREGRNPQTGDTIKIKASKNPAFKAGKALKDAVN
jgi:hypothetical protein